MEEQEKVFMNQATQVNAWDRLLIGNGEKVNLCQIKHKSPMDPGCNLYIYIYILAEYAAQMEVITNVNDIFVTKPQVTSPLVSPRHK